MCFVICLDVHSSRTLKSPCGCVFFQTANPMFDATSRCCCKVGVLLGTKHANRVPSKDVQHRKVMCSGQAPYKTWAVELVGTELNRRIIAMAFKQWPPKLEAMKWRSNCKRHVFHRGIQIQHNLTIATCPFHWIPHVGFVKNINTIMAW